MWRFFCFTYYRPSARVPGYPPVEINTYPVPPKGYFENTTSDVFLPSLVPGSSCLGPSLLGLDDQKGRQELRPRGPSSMLPSAQLSKMPLINLSMTFRPLIYLRINISNLLLPLLRWDSLVMRTKFRS